MGRSRFGLYVSFLVACLVLMTLQLKHGPLGAVSYLSGKFRSADLAADNAFESLSERRADVSKMRTEIEALKDENRRLNFEALSLKQSEAENARLRALLSLQVRTPRYVTAARVISYGADRWASTLIINRGARHGVVKDMAVLAPAGLLGKVVQVDEETSVVLLLDDERFSASVRLSGSRSHGILSGMGTGTWRCWVKYVSTSEEVREGEELITSGTDAMFPPGIIVGKVSAVNPSSVKHFHEITVEPAADARNAEEVVVAER